MSTEREELSGCGTEGLASEIGSYSIYNNDCLKQMASMGSDSVDAIVTDPPYGLSFMGKEWDSFGNDARQPGDEHYVTADNPYGRQKVRYGYGPKFRDGMVAFQEAMTPIFVEALRVAKPGAHMLCFGGTRTFHRLACAIEDAGWDVRDCVMWVYGSGFPHSMDVGKKLPDWDGWGTCLKPAWEPIILARKPLDGTATSNVSRYGTGAMNIDSCRVPIDSDDDVFAKNPHTRSKGKDSGIYGRYNAQQSDWSGAKGRFPANLVHDGSDEVTALFPETGRSSGGGMHTRGTAGHESTNTYGDFTGGVAVRNIGLGDSGSAARFFYCAKASKKERGYGNDHPTVKPNALMRWCVRLICRPGGLVLDPFMGSGSTGIACMQEGMSFVGIELDEHYCEIAERRISESDMGADEDSDQMKLFE